MTIQEIFEITEGNSKKIMLYLRKEENLQSLIDATNNLPNNIDKSTRYYCWLNHITELPKCPYCGKPKKFHDLQKGFFATCGDAECRSKAKSDANRTREVDWVEVHKKMEETYAAKHNGIRHNMQDPEAKAKFYEDYKNKHNGETCGVQSQKAKENREKAFNEKYEGNIVNAFEQGIIKKFGSRSECARRNALVSTTKQKETKLNKLIERVNTLETYEFVSADDEANTITIRCKVCGNILTMNRAEFNKQFRDYNTIFCENCGFDSLIQAYNDDILSQRQLIAIIKLSENYITELKCRTNFLDEYDSSINERLYCVINDIHEIVKCVSCGKKALWNSKDAINIGYDKTCGDDECLSKLIGEIQTGSTIITETRNAEFIKWQSTVTEVNDDVIINGIKFLNHLNLIDNEILLKYLLNRFDDSESLEETYQRIKLGVEHKPICENPNCNNPVTWIGRQRALFSRFCCEKCSATDPNVRKKIYLSLKESCLHSTSHEEIELGDIFRRAGYKVVTHYKSIVYPFNCDIYLPEYDIYVEYQGSHFHHRKPFTGSPEDLKELELLKQKAEVLESVTHKGSQYRGIIETWSERDVLKRKVAKRNDVKLLEIFKYSSDENAVQQLEKFISDNNIVKK